MLGKGSARLYNVMSIIFLVLSVIWIIFVILQIAS